MYILEESGRCALNELKKKHTQKLSAFRKIIVKLYLTVFFLKFILIIINTAYKSMVK